MQCAAAGTPRGSGQVVAQHQTSDYHIITIPVKKYLEVIEGEEDSFWEAGSLRMEDGEFKSTRIWNGDAGGRPENLEKRA